MSRKVVLVLFVVALSLLVAAPALAGAGGRPGSTVVVYVESQGLFYDSIVGPELPPHGPFQLLETGGPDGTLKTEFGPGDPGYVGGRWKMADGNGGFKYFSCPLLGPGRASP